MIGANGRGHGAGDGVLDWFGSQARTVILRDWVVLLLTAPVLLLASRLGADYHVFVAMAGVTGKAELLRLARGLPEEEALSLLMPGAAGDRRNGALR